MAEGTYSHGCRPDWQFKSYTGLGSYLRRDGGYPEHWVGGGIYQVFAAHHWECTNLDSTSLGGPVKDYGLVAEANYGQGAQGQWFERGCITYGSELGQPATWHIMYGYYGQGQGVAEFEWQRYEGLLLPPEHELLLAPPALPA